MLPPIAFNLVNLPMLGWLAAAAAPILIHLWSRRKFSEVPWAAMQYLLAAIQRHTRRLRFEQWLLLAIRTLLIVLLVLAVAQPELRRPVLVTTSSERTHRVLVVDGSFSMEYRDDGTSRFEQAKELARQIVEQSRDGDAFTLLRMAQPPQAVVRRPAMQPAEVIREIDDLKLLHTSADLAGTVELVQQLIEDCEQTEPERFQHEVYFLSDLDHAAWAPELSTQAEDALRQQCRELAAVANLVVIDLGRDESENVAVTGLRCPQQMTTPGRNVALEVTLENFGRQGRSRQPVELLVDGRPVERQYIDLPAAGDAVVPFSYRFSTPGEHTVEARTPDDALAVDNRRWLSIPVRETIRVLCINGRPTGDPTRGAVDYLRVALAARGRSADPGRIETEIDTESALVERKLARYDCVFLCEVPQLSPGEARLLHTYVANGGGLVVFLGEGVLAERYNRELAGGDRRLRLLPAPLLSVVDTYQGPIDPVDYLHPIVREFREHQQAGLLTTPIYKHFQIELPDDSAANVVLKTGKGDPLITEESIGRGHVILVTTSASADTSWTRMPIWPSFLPIVQEMVAFCAGSRYQRRNVPVGHPIGSSETVRGGEAGGAVEVSLRLDRPSGRQKQRRIVGDGDYVTWSDDRTTTAGIYTAALGPPINRQRKFAVNVSPVESAMGHVDEAALQQGIWRNVPFRYETTVREADEEPLASRPGRVHVALLYVVLGLLFLETILAWRFGHHEA